MQVGILKVIQYPNKVLESKTEKVKSFDGELHNLLDDMYETMQEYNGVGLAAPQIGILKQIAIIDIGDETGKHELINPEIITKRGKQTDMEGCLSIPNLYGDVIRPLSMRIKARNRYGKAFILDANGFLARAIEHEIDHLHGILFPTKAIKLYSEDELERLN